jgi:uncharacterized protein YdeI (YjbR/CyaY-like superfamily)
MKNKNISNGTVHNVPADMKSILTSKTKTLEWWQSLTPLARNEWICWIEDAKKDETRKRRMEIMLDKFSRGERRPCCWAGCIHRGK